eukprot:COSAG05_NODE_439_length_9821_cov_110.691556_8_plen_59_part_00
MSGCSFVPWIEASDAGVILCPFEEPFELDHNLCCLGVERTAVALRFAVHRVAALDRSV